MKHFFSYLFIIAVATILVCCGSEKRGRDQGSSDSTSGTVLADTSKYLVTKVNIDTTDDEPSPGFAAAPSRASKEARKSWDNVFKNCQQGSSLDSYGDFLGVGSVQAVGQQMVKSEFGPVQNGVSFDINWFMPEVEKARKEIFAQGASGEDVIIDCTGKTGKKISLNALLGGNFTLPKNLDAKVEAEIKTALEKKVEQTISLKWKRKEINILVLPPYVERVASSNQVAKIYFDNLLKEDIMTLTKGIIIESFKTKLTVDKSSEVSVLAAFKNSTTLSLNADFGLKVEQNKEIYLESSKAFVIRGSFYQFKKRPI